MIRHKNSVNEHIIEIYPEKLNGKSAYFVSSTDKTHIKDKEFKSKSQALTFAKKYMRSN